MGFALDFPPGGEKIPLFAGVRELRFGAFRRGNFYVMIVYNIKEHNMLLGFADAWVELAVGLAVLSTLGCAVYGAINWNRGDDTAPSNQTMIWLRDDKKIKEEEM